MCGIFCYIHKLNTIPKNLVHLSALKISHRGEDATHAIHGTTYDNQWEYKMVFHRLAINGVTPESGQPLFYPARCGRDPYLYLMCNGEIYNHQELEEQYNISCNSDSDCEIILHLYKKFGLQKTLTLLRGVYSICLLDLRENTLHIARDPYGVRGMCYFKNENGIGICSELKGLVDLEEQSYQFSSIQQFPPGCYESIKIGSSDSKPVQYYDLAPKPISIDSNSVLLHECAVLFEQAVKRRLMCDRKDKRNMPSIGACLSGGFDSSTVAALVQKNLPSGVKLRTFSIGFRDSPDLLRAAEVAEFIGSEHHSYIVTEDEMLSFIPDVIQQIESYDVTTVRASTFMWLLFKFINRDFPDISVIFTGEGADEASGSYMYFHSAPDDTEFHNECHRLLYDICYFDALRVDRCSGGHNKEARIPFLDIDFLRTYLTVPPQLKTVGGVEKHFLRNMVSTCYPDLLPEHIIWRPKEAMSDGVSTHSLSWYQIIQRYIKKDFKGRNMLSDLQMEKDWYLSIFLSNYPRCKHILPYYWQPKWTDTEDPSARLLNVYRK